MQLINQLPSSMADTQLHSARSSQPGGAYLTANINFTDDQSGADYFLWDLNLSIPDNTLTSFQIHLTALRVLLLEGTFLKVKKSILIPPMVNGQIYISGQDKAGNNFNIYHDDPGWNQFLEDSNIQQTSFTSLVQKISLSISIKTVGRQQIHLHTVQWRIDPITITKEQRNGGIQTFSNTAIPNWCHTSHPCQHGSAPMSSSRAQITEPELISTVWPPITRASSQMEPVGVRWSTAQNGWEVFSKDLNSDGITGLPKQPISIKWSGRQQIHLHTVQWRIWSNHHHERTTKWWWYSNLLKHSHT